MVQVTLLIYICMIFGGIYRFLFRFTKVLRNFIVFPACTGVKFSMLVSKNGLPHLVETRSFNVLRMCLMVISS